MQIDQFPLRVMLNKVRNLKASETFLLALIRGYQSSVSPYLPAVCRHIPSCSAYAQEAIINHGIRRGVFLSVLRVLRCNPFGTKGYDPVPSKKPNSYVGKQECV